MLRQGTILHQRYQVLEHIGDGGMGAVYRALDMRLDNNVAVKRMLLSPLPERVAAFQREARLLARLHHPALPAVHDHFAEQGDHFLVMEYIEGQDLSELLRANGGPFDARTVLLWADLLLDALNYLHKQQPAVIHRDIKPHNLKLAPNGQIMLLDFGLAKGAAGANGADHEGRSVHGFTLQYAPFEQIRGAGTDARSDLYALAATLYHLLAGVPPPNAPTRVGAQNDHQPDPLPPLNIRVPNLPPEIDAALRKSLAMKPEDRHASAAELRAELRAAPTPPPALPVVPARTHAEPTLPPPHASESADSVSVSAAPRVPAPARTAPLLILALALSIGMLALMVLIAVAPGTLRRVPFITDPAQLVKIAVIAYTVLLTLFALGSGVRRHSKRALGMHADTILSVAFAPNGELIGSAANDGAIHIWRTGGAAPIVCRGHHGPVRQIGFTPASDLLVSGADDGTVRIWQARDGAQQSILHEHRGRISCIAVAANSPLLASAATDGTIIVWGLRERAPLHTLQGHSLGTVGLALSPDGGRLASAGEDGRIRIWSTRSGALIHTLADHTDAVCEIAFSPDGRTLASCARDTSVRLWNVRDGRLLHTLRDHTLPVSGLAFHPGGELLASRSEDATVRLWNVRDGRLVHTLRGHTRYISGIAFVQGGDTLASASWDGSLRLWGVRDGRERGTLLERGARILLLAASQNGNALATGGMDRAVRFWQV